MKLQIGKDYSNEIQINSIIKLSWHEKKVKAIFKSVEEEAEGQGSEEASNTLKLDLPKFSLFQVFT